MSQTLSLLIVLGAIFGALGAMMAYLITYKEWVRHYPSPEIPRKMALEAAIMTFVFFLGVAILVGVFL